MNKQHKRFWVNYCFPTGPSPAEEQLEGEAWVKSHIAQHGSFSGHRASSGHSSLVRDSYSNLIHAIIDEE